MHSADLLSWAAVCGLFVCATALAVAVPAGAPPGDARATLAQPLPPLPAGTAAAVHHTLALRRRRLLDGFETRPGAGAVDGVDLAHAVWALEPRSGGGFGHGLTVVGRVP